MFAKASECLVLMNQLCYHYICDYYALWYLNQTLAK